MSGNVSEVDVAMILAVFRYMSGPIQTDWQAVATALNYKNVGVAKVRWGQMKKKLQNTVPGSIKKGELPTTPKAPRTKKRKLNEVVYGDDGNSDTEDTSVKKEPQHFAELPGTLDSFQSFSNDVDAEEDGESSK